MRPITAFTFAIAGLLLAGSCRKGEARRINCEKIRTGLLQNNKETVKEEINRITLSFTPDLAASDAYGQRKGLDSLVRLLNGECNLSASLLCYNCIYTLPPESEVSISVTSGATTTRRIIDLTYDDKRRLVFSNMHD